MSVKLWSNLAKVVYKRTYARKDFGPTETWTQTIDRVIEGNIGRFRGTKHLLPNEEDRLRYLMLNRKAGPAGRGYWFSGAPSHARIGGVALNNCFSGDTRFFADGRLQSFKEVVGRSVSVICADGKQRKAVVSKFGEQALFKITMSPRGGGAEQYFYATRNHMWLTERGDTTDLQVGDQVRVNPREALEDSQDFKNGFAHGLIFGDGTRHTYYPERFAIRLCGDKSKHLDALMKQDGFVSVARHLSSNFEAVVTLKSQINLKEVPGDGTSWDYQAGFYNGWFAADGSTRGRLGSTDHAAIDWLRERAPLLGVVITGDIIDSNLETNFGVRSNQIRTLTIKNESSLLFVRSIEDLNIVEPVYCVTEPETRSFTLEYGTVTGNCWFVTSEEWNNFVIAMDLLMLGGGVGMSVEQRFASKLPKIKRSVVIQHKGTKDADFIVPDSREGWCELFRRTLEAFFVTGKGFTYSTVCVRGYGESIVGFGGTASGPIPLIKFIENVCALLLAREGKHIRPIDAMDLLCCTGEMVVAGNVRRSAIIILGDPFDKEYLKSKRWDLGPIPTWRAFANLSVVCEDVDEDLTPLFWKTYENGEPFGIVNRKNIQTYGRMGEKKKDTAVGVNPCVPAGTEILTETGYEEIQTLVGKTINVWNGFEWSMVTPRVTGHNQEMVKVALSDGRSLTCTIAHKFVLSTDYRGGAERKDAQDLVPGDKLIKHKFPVIEGGEAIKWAYGQGFLSGDGMDGYTGFTVYGEKVKCIPRMNVEIGAYSESQDRTYVSLRFDPKPKNFVPETWDVQSSLDWLAGLIDADGTRTIEGGCQIVSVDHAFLSKVQRMLTTLGVQSKVCDGRDAGERSMPNGRGGTAMYMCKESKRILIGSTQIQDLLSLGMNTERVSFEASPQREAIRFTTVISVEPAGVADVVYCFTEPKRNLGCFNGVLTGQCAEATLENFEPCNLQEIPLPNLDSVEEFEEAGILMHRWGKRVTTEFYHHPQVMEVIGRNRRVGTGITGCLQAPQFFNPSVLDRVYDAIQRENRDYSKQLNIPESIRTTVIKPSGTISKVMDVTEGIHASYSRYFIQRIRFGANDPLIPILKAAGHHMEPQIRFDGTLDHNTMVVDFYVQTPEGTPVADEEWNTWRQLDVVKMAAKHWADQAVSVTVYYKKEELPELKQWLRDNLQHVKTISFLCHSEHGFKQAPKEAITKEQYEKLAPKVREIAEDGIQNSGDLEGLECEGGICPMK